MNGVDDGIFDGDGGIILGCDTICMVNEIVRDFEEIWR